MYQVVFCMARGKRLLDTCSLFMMAAGNTKHNEKAIRDHECVML